MSSAADVSTIGIIGGADGPTVVIVSSPAGFGKVLAVALAALVVAAVVFAAVRFLRNRKK